MYTIIESKQWRNSKTGATASIFGSVPYCSDADKPDWKLETKGFTVRNERTGVVGIGRAPFTTREEAQAWIDSRKA